MTVAVHADHFIIQIGHRAPFFGMEVFPADRLQDGLNVLQSQDALVIVDEDQEYDVLPCILLALRGRKKIVLRIIVDHGFGEDLILLKTA